MALRKLGLLASCGAFLICLFASSSAQAQAINPDAARRVGLTVHWQSQFRLDRYRETISDFALHIHDDRSISYYEVIYSGNRETISFDDLNPRGVAFRDIYPEEPGRGAQEWAEYRKEILEAEGKTDVQINLITVPKTTIFALTSTGTVHAIDAETGNSRWVTKVGKPSYTSVGLAVNNKNIIVVRGSQVHCLSIENGQQAWQQQCDYSPGGGVAISEKYAYVTTIDGRLLVFDMENKGIPQVSINSYGPATFDPKVTASTVSWTTETGYFNVAKSDELKFQYRMKTRDGFSTSGTGVGEYLIATSSRGTVYGIAENYGSMVWEFAVGEHLTKQPIALGSNVALIITAADQLLALDVTTGKIVDGWPKRVRDVNEYIGVGQDAMYFTNRNNQMVVLRRDSGTRIGSIGIGRDKIVIPNTVTDRLYIADQTGAIICLREMVNINPIIISEQFEIGSKEEKKQDQDKKERPKDSEGENPFGEEKKPGVGESTDPFGEESDDPFAEGGEEMTEESDDPFGEGGSDEDEESDDPFGGDSNESGEGGEEEEEDDDPFGGG